MRDFLASTPGPGSARLRRRLTAPGLLLALGALSSACGGADAESTASSPLFPTGNGGSAGSAGSSVGAGGASAGSGGASTGGAGGSAGAGGQVAGGGGGGTPASFSPFGYFDVELTTVEASIAAGPKQKEPPTKKTKLRIDIPEPSSAGAWKAVVTPRWGTPAVFDVKMTDDAIVLTGSVSVVGNYPDLAVTDVWQSFSIPLSAKKAKGMISAVGQEDLVSGDEGWTGKLAGSGQVSPDATQPEAHPGSATGFGPSYGMLPWDPIPVAFAEPLAQEQALSTIGLFDDAKSEGESVDVLWMVPSQAKATGVSQVLGYLKGWDQPLGSPRLHVGTGYVDPAQNPGTGFDQGFAMLKVPAPDGSMQGFEGDVIHYASWGPAIQLGGLAPAPECESYGCVLLGPFMNGACGVDAAGVAGRLMPEKLAKQVRVRLRVLFAVDEPTQGVPTYLTNVPAVSLQLARPGKLPEAADIIAPSPEDLGDQAGEFRYATPWTTVTRPLPSGAGEVGFALRAGGALATGSCDGNGVQPNLKTKVLIESVALE